MSKIPPEVLDAACEAPEYRCQKDCDKNYRPTLARRSSERETTGGETSVGEDRRVQPRQERGDPRVYVRNVLCLGLY